VAEGMAAMDSPSIPLSERFLSKTRRRCDPGEFVLSHPLPGEPAIHGVEEIDEKRCRDRAVKVGELGRVKTGVPAADPPMRSFCDCQRIRELRARPKSCLVGLCGDVSCFILRVREQSHSPQERNLILMANSSLAAVVAIDREPR